MFGSDNFFDKSHSQFVKILKLFKHALGQFILNHTPKHVNSSTNMLSKLTELLKQKMNDLLLENKWV